MSDKRTRPSIRIAKDFLDRFDRAFVIGVTGPIAAGKTTISRLISKKWKFYMAACGDTVTQLVAREYPSNVSPVVDSIVREAYQILEEGGIPQLKNPPRQVLLKAGELLRKSIDPEIVLALTIAKSSSGCVVVDGVRGPGEILFIQKHLLGSVIFVDAPREIRFQRVKERKASKDRGILTISNFIGIDSTEEYQFKHYVEGIHLADIIIHNRDYEGFSRVARLFEAVRRCKA